MPNEKLIEAIKKKAIELRKAGRERNIIPEAMRQCGVRNDDPDFAGIQSDVVASFREETKQRREEERLLRAAKWEDALRDAAAHQARMPRDAWSNDH